MSEPDELRQRAEALLAMALKAREEGQLGYAETLVAEASRFISEADELETQARITRNAQDIQPVRRSEKKD
jgi:cellobiose-specific phosphotransferase system component IIA